MNQAEFEKQFAQVQEDLKIASPVERLMAFAMTSAVLIERSNVSAESRVDLYISLFTFVIEETTLNTCVKIGKTVMEKKIPTDVVLAKVWTRAIDEAKRAGVQFKNLMEMCDD